MSQPRFSLDIIHGVVMLDAFNTSIAIFGAIPTRLPLSVSLTVIIPFTTSETEIGSTYVPTPSQASPSHRVLLKSTIPKSYPVPVSVSHSQVRFPGGC